MAWQLFRSLCHSSQVAIQTRAHQLCPCNSFLVAVRQMKAVRSTREVARGRLDH